MKTANRAAEALLASLLVALIATVSCTSTSIQDEMAILANILEPEIDLYEAQSTNPSSQEHVAIARGVVALLRTGADPEASIDKVRDLRPIFVAWLQSRGKSEQQIEDIIRPIRIALTILEARIARNLENRPQ